MNVGLRKMSAEELKSFLERHEGEYAAERAAAGEPPDTARKRAAASTTELFPGGRPKPGHLLFTVVEDEEPIGLLWIGPHPDGVAGAMWVWDIEIAESHRGRGVGRRTMELAEEEAVSLGAGELALNVFGHNEVAIGLYRSLGYLPTSMQLRKRIGSKAATPG